MRDLTAPVRIRNTFTLNHESAEAATSTKGYGMKIKGRTRKEQVQLAGHWNMLGGQPCLHYTLLYSSRG
jgi:hypothetical protein